jgi:hypothetical protein
VSCHVRVTAHPAGRGRRGGSECLCRCGRTTMLASYASRDPPEYYGDQRGRVKLWRSPLRIVLPHGACRIDQSYKYIERKRTENKELCLSNGKVISPSLGVTSACLRQRQASGNDNCQYLLLTDASRREPSHDLTGIWSDRHGCRWDCVESPAEQAYCLLHMLNALR